MGNVKTQQAPINTQAATAPTTKTPVQAPVAQQYNYTPTSSFIATPEPVAYFPPAVFAQPTYMTYQQPVCMPQPMPCAPQPMQCMPQPMQCAPQPMQCAPQQQACAPQPCGPQQQANPCQQ